MYIPPECRQRSAGPDSAAPLRRADPGWIRPDASGRVFSAVPSELGFSTAYIARVNTGKEEFTEDLTRRFAQSYGKLSTYRIKVYDIIEEPPKVSVLLVVDNKAKVYNYDAIDFDIMNRIDSILETDY